MLAERYFPDDPNTCLLKLRQLTELLAELVAARTGLYGSPEEPQYDLVRRLHDRGLLPREVAQLFGEVRRAGNAAVHEGAGDHRTALAMLRFSWQLGLWYHRIFGNRAFKSGPFIPPAAPPDESAALRAELDRLTKALDEYRATHEHAARELEATREQLRAAQEDQAFWEQTASEAEVAKAHLADKLSQASPFILKSDVALKQFALSEQPADSDDVEARLAADTRLSEIQSQAVAQPPDVAEFVLAANQAADQVDLDEADTRKIIDDQLRERGWEADSETLRYANGARPEKGRNRAIAEWPTANGPADYVLFVGLTPIAALEAKRSNVNVSASLQQAQRYALGLEAAAAASRWGDYKLPFVFSTNARPYLKQLETHSGIWFRDVRRASNLARAVDGWYTPEGLEDLLKRDEAAADSKLAVEPFDYGFPLRPYQRDAIQTVERAVADGKRSLLLAMATGTGKTKTCVALIYRFLKTQRFNRVLFLVDRSALGEQAANAFKDTRMENLNTFATIFGIKELDEAAPEADTKVHIATVQGMVQRLFGTGDDPAPPVDRYDCIVVDECHRGYLLDRELSDTELTFRGFEDYVSQYRRVIDYFDAVKVGLTATPALHTVQIFGMPAFSYGYREAVVDGFLVDHEPPVQIRTVLSTAGIKWKKGEDIQRFDPMKSQIELFKAPDEITLEIEDFNRKVVTESFNRVVCEYLARELDPSSPQKTLVFCANDAHADLVVKLLKEAFQARYGEVDDDAVIKITGSADRPLQLIRRYKNERQPNVAVTVDLLTTGIDVPEICNLVFLRRVNSRILFDQMLGRATRLAPEIGKEAFRVFDAVRLYEALGSITAMQPVVTNPDISFSQLSRELGQVRNDEQRRLVLDQFLAKLQRKKQHLNARAQQDFETVCGMAPDDFVQKLKEQSLRQVAEWFTQHPQLGEILDRKAGAGAYPVLISTHEDTIEDAPRGYGAARKPQDYIAEFTAFLRENGNRLPALTAVLMRPRELTRKQLRELLLALDQAGYTERNLEVAWREMTNQDIAARILGFIRQAALGDALIPYDERVDGALKKILSRQPWTAPQRRWLQTIAEQTKVNLLVDRECLDEPDLIFRREGGGFQRLDKLFDGRLIQVLNEFNDFVWPGAA
jgi:type I restriction enzyme R subunit